MGFEASKDLRGCKDSAKGGLPCFEGGLFSFGGLPYLIYIIIRASRTARRLRGLEDGAKVGFSLSDCLRGFQKSLFGFEAAKVGFDSARAGRSPAKGGLPSKEESN